MTAVLELAERPATHVRTRFCGINRTIADDVAVEIRAIRNTIPLWTPTEGLCTAAGRSSVLPQTEHQSSHDYSGDSAEVRTHDIF